MSQFWLAVIKMGVEILQASVLYQVWVDFTLYT